MRSNKNGTTRFLLKRHLYIGVIVFLAVFFLLPFWGLSHIPNEKASIMLNTIQLYRDQELTRLVSSSVFQDAVSLEALTVIFGGLGFLTALTLMSHLFSRRQCMLQFSLPDKRESDWLRRFACYLVLCVGPILINLFIYVAIVFANGLLPWISWGKLLAKCGMLLLINLYGFAIGMLASVLTGTYWSVLLAGAVLIVGAEGFCVIWDYLAGCYLHTYVSGLGRLVRTASPAYTLYKGLYQPERFMCLPALVVIPAALVLSLLLYRIRKAEAAERTLAFPLLDTLLGVLLPMAGGSLMGVVMQLSFLTEWSLYAGFVLGAVLTFWVCRILFSQRICGIGKQWYLPLLAALVLCVGGLLLYTDALGYDRFLPDRSEVTAITYSPIYGNDDQQITLTSPETLDAAHEWCTLMRDEAETLPRGFEASTYAETTCSVTITYHMNGRDVMRKYLNDSARTEAQPQLKCILESKDYCESLLLAHPLGEAAAQSLFLGLNDTPLDMNELQAAFGLFPEFNGLERATAAAAIDQRIAAFKEDLRQRTFEEKCQDPIFTLVLHSEDPDRRYYSSYLNVYPGDENLLYAIFGSKAQAIVEYLTGGYAATEDTLVLKTTYAVSRQEFDQNGLPLEDAIVSVEMPATPEEAAQWVREAHHTSARRLYYMPNLEDQRYCRLTLYNLKEVAEMAGLMGYTVPENPTDYANDPGIPFFHVLDYVE